MCFQNFNLNVYLLCKPKKQQLKIVKPFGWYVWFAFGACSVWLVPEQQPKSIKHFVRSINDSVAVNKYLEILIALWSCNTSEETTLHVVQDNPCTFFLLHVTTLTVRCWTHTQQPWLIKQNQSLWMKSILNKPVFETYPLCCVHSTMRYALDPINNAETQKVIIIRIIWCGFRGSLHEIQKQRKRAAHKSNFLSIYVYTYWIWS